jgi:hypothetical protein
MMLATFGGYLMSWWVAWLIHLASSLIEGYAWRDIFHRTGLTFILVACLDMGSTAYGLFLLAQERGIVVTLPVQVGIGLLTLFLALLPERMIVGHLSNLGVLGSLERTFKGREDDYA